MMNFFRMIADLLHLTSKIILISTVLRNRSCVGLSLKSQILYLIVFLSRYADLFIHFYSIYNTTMKVIYIATSAVIIFLMLRPFKASYDKETDIVWISPILLISLILGLCLNYKMTLMEVMWTFSIYLEAMAIIPQLWMTYKHKESQDSITIYYLATLGLYRFFYILNWVYRYQTESGYYDPISQASGVFQTVVYILFVCLYFRRPYYLYSLGHEPTEVQLDSVLPSPDEDTLEDEEKGLTVYEL